MKLIWSRRFRDELRREFQFLRERNPSAAEVVFDRIYSSALHLAEFPKSGRSWPIPGCWQLVIPGLPYIVVYRINGDVVEILSLFHTSREFPNVH